MHLPKRGRGRAFTLTELLVAVAIIAALFALAALFFPRYREAEVVSRGADALQGWLLQARQRARRDGLPTGLRFQFKNGWATSVVWVQEPGDVAVGLYTGADPADDHVATFAQKVSLKPGDASEILADFNFLDTGQFPHPPAAGDYLVVMGGGPARRVAGVASATSLALEAGAAPLSVLPLPPPPAPQQRGPAPQAPGEGNARTNYRLILAPRPLPNEQALTLPEGVAIADGKNGSRNIAPLPPPSADGQILFAPSGALVGTGQADGQAIFWVEHQAARGRRTLVTVQTRTGFIAAQPVSSGKDPYEFTKDGRSSGL